jgi:hypothetical protein
LTQDPRVLLVATEVPGIGGIVDEGHRVIDGHDDFLPLTTVEPDSALTTFDRHAAGNYGFPRLRDFAESPVHRVRPCRVHGPLLR